MLIDHGKTILSISLLEALSANFSVTQQSDSSTTRLYLVGEGEDFGDTEVKCGYSFSGAVTSDSLTTIIRGHIGSKASVKFLNEGTVSLSALLRLSFSG